MCNEIQSYGIARKKDERAVTHQPRQGMSNKQQLSTDATRRWLGELLGELSGENQRKNNGKQLSNKYSDDDDLGYDEYEYDVV